MEGLPLPGSLKGVGEGNRGLNSNMKQVQLKQGRCQSLGLANTINSEQAVTNQLSTTSSGADPAMGGSFIPMKGVGVCNQLAALTVFECSGVLALRSSISVQLRRGVERWQPGKRGALKSPGSPLWICP